MIKKIGNQYSDILKKLAQTVDEYEVFYGGGLFTRTTEMSDAWMAFKQCVEMSVKGDAKDVSLTKNGQFIEKYNVGDPLEKWFDPEEIQLITGL